MWGTVRGGKISSWTDSEGSSLIKSQFSGLKLTVQHPGWENSQARRKTARGLHPRAGSMKSYQLVHLKLKPSHKFLNMLPRRGMQAVFFWTQTWVCPEYQPCKAAARTEKLWIEAVHRPGWDEQQHDMGSKAGFVQSGVLPTAQSVPTQHWHRYLHNSHIIHNVSLWLVYFHQSAKLPYFF